MPPPGLSGSLLQVVWLEGGSESKRAGALVLSEAFCWVTSVRRRGLLLANKGAIIRQVLLRVRGLLCSRARGV
ncbi:hypothetical protein DL89DRAFT_80075 [Linderina pennispora]|uniref:Uncharacterized protein n=1 Tax=Linderina pennispora TaxID=61395 RepID=A0A1Y1WGW5_9FUNG|nr:uncharacterized protein DL89DRAFT_80075 [Linderina pennispora]ORX72625.1 hypothetical protein DL89DRAFT_80075 [Linderina pennispora]